MFTLGYSFQLMYSNLVHMCFYIFIVHAQCNMEYVFLFDDKDIPVLLPYYLLLLFFLSSIFSKEHFNFYRVCHAHFFITNAQKKQ